jgi:hypothetical protein
MNTTITVIAAAIIVVGIAFLVRARAQEPRKADPASYVGLRSQALSVSRASIGLPPSRQTAPAAVLMDVGADGYTITTVAIPDGTASIYLSNGGGFIGGGQRYESIRSAAVEMVRAAEASLGGMTIVNSFPTPRAGHTTFYVVTDAGVYSADVGTENVEKPQHPLYALYSAGQNIITQYRLSQAPR